MRIQMTRKRKAILTGGVILVLMALGYLVLPAIRGAYPSQEAIDLKREKLVKYRQKVQEKVGLEKELSALQHTVQRTESGLLAGKTASLAAVEVQQIVSDIVKNSGGQIRTTRILSPGSDSRERYTAIPVEISLQATISQLVDILYDISTAGKLLRTAAIDIRTIGSRTTEQFLISTFTVEGFMKNPEE